MAASLLETRGLSKHYPGTVALDGVSISFSAGEVHALLGRNGAGKSTLVKILCGATQPTRGEVLVRGRPVELSSTRAALRHGIATVHQELSIAPELSVAENLLLGRLPTRRSVIGPIVDWRAACARTEDALAALSVQIDPRAVAGRLSVAQQQIVEIARAMSFEPAALLLDEPTSALAHHDVESLLSFIRRLAQSGVAVVYITHRLSELHNLAHRVSVLRDGRLAATMSRNEMSSPAIVEAMFGGMAVRSSVEAAPVADAPTVLDVRGLTVPGRVFDVGFSISRGEVVGIAGMMGAGRSELLLAIAGAINSAGRVAVCGREVERRTPARMKNAGVVLVPEDRKTQGLVLSMSTRDNLWLSSLKRLSRFGVWSRRRVDREVSQTVRDLSVAVSDLTMPVSTLSGGNQQKVVVGDRLATRPTVVLFDEPTRGIDVQAKAKMFEVIRGLASRGLACLVVSSEWEELLELCHRLLIMRAGRIVGNVGTAGMTLERLIELCQAP